jgi:hypothetical protein
MKDLTFEIDGYVVRVLEGPYWEEGKPTPAARELAAHLIKQLDEMRAFASQKYLDLYNDTWREDDDPILNQEEFCSRLIDPGIVLYDELGAAAIYFDDSEMFAGHSIEVWVEEGKIVNAKMVG